VNAALEIFLAANLVREGTAFLLEALKGNKKVSAVERFAVRLSNRIPSPLYMLILRHA
jgi:hypothetical protein